jgi:hypothetical protein
MSQFTDFLDNPINVGDTIIIPFHRGSSSVGLNIAVVENIDELIPFEPANPEHLYGYLDKQRNRPINERTRHEIHSDWLETAEEMETIRKFNPNARWTRVRDMAKAYQLDVRHPGAKKTNRIKRVDRVVVVTSLVSA